MGSYYLSKPVTEKESEEKSNAILKCGISSMQGWRDSQEDAHSCILDYDLDTSYFAVFDGHGGRNVAEYCSLKLPEYIKNLDIYKEGDIEKALVEGFMNFDKSLITEKVDEELAALGKKSHKLLELQKQDHSKDEVGDGKDNEVMKHLYEEVSMCLGQVMEQYIQKDKSVAKVGKDSNPNVDTSNEEEGSKAGSSVECADEVSSSNSDARAETRVSLNGDHSDSISSKTDEQNSDANGDNVISSSSPQENEDKSTGNKKRITPIRVSEAKLKQKADELCTDLLDLEESKDQDLEDEDEEPNEANSDDESSEDDVGSSEEGSSDEEEEDEGEEIEEEEADEDEEKVCYHMGCTAVVTILRDQKLYVANAGDSRCVVCREGKAIEMTSDHKPEDEPERSRIKKAGGRVRGGRIDGELNLSRAFGDFKYKKNKNLPAEEQKIIVLPDIKTLDISPGQDEFMIIACDGIWTSMSSQEVVDFVRLKIKEGKKLTDICEEMFDHILSPSGWKSSDGVGCDNMTALIVQFNTGNLKRSSSSELTENESKRTKTEDSDPHVDTTTRA